MNLLKDNVPNLVKKLALPAMVGTLFQTLYNIVDTYFAGKISAEALSAIAQTFPVFFIIIAMGVGISIGITALIANAIGEKKDNEASYLLAQGVILSIVIAIFITIIGILIAPHIISTISKSTTSLDLSIEYLNIFELA